MHLKKEKNKGYYLQKLQEERHFVELLKEQTKLEKKHDSWKISKKRMINL